MKRLLIALVAGSFLATPMAALAQSPYRFEVVDAHSHKRRHVEHRADRGVVIKKHRWARGHRLTPAERRRIAYVHDYRRYKLHPPPRGQQWVRVDNDFLLISLATGVIAGLVSAR
ncbi:MAG TPA: RcnB family protein [Sinorhizobium sp.]|nr:RcnB family protein [Sinorhizobium sp.]